MTSNEQGSIPDEAAETREAETGFPVVGIGASAGGLEAASELLSGLCATTGMAFLLVQHLDPRHGSRLAEIVAKKTPFPVAEVKDTVTIEPDHLYVISPNTNLTLANGRLSVSPREASTADHMPIDTLFQSLAGERGHKTVGVILSGTGSDGTRGLQAIKAAGGITFVENPAKAEFPGMPRSAIEARCADYVMSPRAIAEALVRIDCHADLKEGAAAAMEYLACPDAHLQRIFRLLFTGCGIDFSHYKPSTFRRRVARRMTMRSIAELGAYADLLESSESELQALCQDALIQVTGFFREPQTFKALSDIVFPALLAGRSPKDPIRIWVPGCASGEEVYSLAICLVEFLDARATDTPIQIFGTDVSKMAIEKARAARYRQTAVEKLSAERLQRFFVKLDGHYQCSRSIRDLCIFARQDVACDPPFSKLDLVSCQNLLIYFDQALQKRVLPQFRYALNSGGFLALGRSENVGALSADLFELVDRQYKIYRKPTVPKDAPRGSASIQLPGLPKQAIKAAPTPVDANWGQREAERLLISRYAPACVLVNEDMQVLYFQGETSRYLEHAPGPASLSLPKLARPSLLVELAQAMQAVRKEDAPVRRDVRIMDDDRVREISIEVIPRKLPDAESHHYLILFEPARSRTTAWNNALGSLARRWPAWLMRRWTPMLRGDAAPPTMSRDDQSLQLKHELETTRDYLRALIEDGDAEKETMKLLHEELLSVNEEFQSTNEELETAKEELQASNEELMTTNDELRTRNRDSDELSAALERSRDYARAIIETVGECLLVLDAKYRVLQANHAFYTWFNTRPEETEQRLIYDLEDGAWNIPDLRALLEQILPKKAAFHDFEISHQFPSLGQRTMRFNGRRLAGDPEGRELILLSIDDITARVQREQAALVAEKERYRATLASISEGVIATDAEGHVEYMNKVAEQYTGWSYEEARGLPLAKVFTVVDALTRQPLENAAQIAINSRRPAVMGTHLHLLCRYGEEFPIEATTAPLHGSDAGAITGVVVSFRDVSAERRMAQQLSYQANHDALTGLINRREFERRLRRVIDVADREQMHAMMYLDLDQFKLVNDTCGHSAGDKLLRQITAILQSQMRVRDTLARLGGDEFGVLLEHCPLEEALRVANDLRHSVENFRFVWEGQYFTLGVSIGVVSVTESDGSLEAVLSAADKACYAAKEAGRNRVHVYQLEDEAMARRHGDMQWVPRIQAALDEGRFRLYCQPIVALAPNGSEVDWGEILVRLLDEEGKLILPGDFIPAAERYDLMYNVDRWVIKQTLAIMRTRMSAASPMRCTINLSGQSLGNGDLLGFITEQLEGIEPGRVCFEITESAAIGNLSVARNLISALNSHGCRFALDDFGAGLSSFTYLKNLPVEYLKIDGSFVKSMQQSPVDYAVVEATRHIGQALGAKIIAESVEDTSTLKALKAMGVDYAQGLAIAAPRALEPAR